MKEIDLSEWTLSGGGMAGDSYTNNSDPDLMLKLYPKGANVEYLSVEAEIGTVLRKLGVSCPDPGEIVCCADRAGIVFKRIKNKISFCKAAGQNPEQIPSLAARMAGMLRQLGSIRGNGASFASSKDYYRGLVESLDPASRVGEGARKALEIIEKEYTPTVTHGDFHFGNVITNGETDYFIDLGECRIGNPNIDIAMFWFVTHYPPEEMLLDVYHIDKAGTMEFWEQFKRAYYGDSVHTDEVLYPVLRPYLLLLILSLEHRHGTDPLLESLKLQFA